MATTQTTDQQLILDLVQHEKVILKYHTDGCGAPCLEFAPLFTKLSNTSRYADITFLNINADSNPVARDFILKRKQPIVSIYFKGFLVESRCVTTESEVVALLETLQKHAQEKVLQ